jgi:hypothetical protein
MAKDRERAPKKPHTVFLLQAVELSREKVIWIVSLISCQLEKPSIRSRKLQTFLFTYRCLQDYDK